MFNLYVLSGMIELHVETDLVNRVTDIGTFSFDPQELEYLWTPG